MKVPGGKSMCVGEKQNVLEWGENSVREYHEPWVEYDGEEHVAADDNGEWEYDSPCTPVNTPFHGHERSGTDDHACHD